MEYINAIANYLIKIFDFFASIVNPMIDFILSDSITLIIVIVATVIFLLFAVCKKQQAILGRQAILGAILGRQAILGLTITGKFFIITITGKLIQIRGVYNEKRKSRGFYVEQPCNGFT